MNYTKIIIIINLLFCVNSYGQTDHNNPAAVMNSVKDRIQQSDLVHFPDPPSSSLNMSILIKTFTGMDVVDGSEIACFTPDNLLAGAAALDPDEHEIGWGLAAIGDEPLTDGIEGFTTGEEIRLLFWDPVHAWELEMSVEFRQGDSLYYFTNDFVVIDATLDAKSDEPQLQPCEFSLNNIYPNPFNSTAFINFSLSHKSNIDLGIYDLAGRRIRSLLNGELIAGKHIAIMNGANLQNGIYLIVLESEDQRIVHRAVLIK